jgi:hypothetical protein
MTRNLFEGSSTPIGMAAPMPRRPQSNLGSLQTQSLQPDLVQKSKSGQIQYPVKGAFMNKLHLDSGKKHFQSKVRNFDKLKVQF